MARKNTPFRPPANKALARPKRADASSAPARPAEDQRSNSGRPGASEADAVETVAAEPAAASGGDRLQKYLADQGVGSRRDIETRIAAGQVSVNGATAVLGQRVQPGDVVRIGGRGYKVQANTRLPRVLI